MTTNTTTMVRLVLAAGLALAAQARADEWDVGGDTDNGSSTDNVMFHGSEQTHDMAGLALGMLPDQDWYFASSRASSSYQFVIDGMAGDLDLTSTDVQRLDFSDTTVLQSALVSDAGGTLSLDWLEDGIPNWSGDSNADGGAPISSYLIRVRGASCANGCGSTDRYRARFYDTTCTIPRFNNSGTQTTVLVVQNASDRICSATFVFLTSTGGLQDVSINTLDPNSVFVLATATVVPDLSGSVRIAHTCGYGGLSGKAVSIEPSTGFAFDTQMVQRPH